MSTSEWIAQVTLRLRSAEALEAAKRQLGSPFKLEHWQDGMVWARWLADDLDGARAMLAAVATEGLMSAEVGWFPKRETLRALS